MRLFVRRVLLVVALFASGCDTLFPELFGGSPRDGATSGDAGSDTDGGAPRVAGQLCALADVRTLASCTTGVGAGFRVTIEETRDQTTCDDSGRFSFAVDATLTHATVAAIDPSGAYLPTITVLKPSTATAAIPLAPANVLRQAAINAGFPMDAAGSAVLAWAFDTKGVPVARATVNAGVASLTDGDQANVLVPSDATSVAGLVAFAGALPTSLMFKLTPAAASGLAADTFTLPVRAGAVSITTLVLAPAH